MLMALTGKQQAFADAVLAGSSNKEAAIAAGYSPKTASPAGSRLVKDKAVAKYLAGHGWVAPTARASTPSKPAPLPPPPDDGAGSADYGYTSDPEVLLIAMMNDTALDARVRGDFAKALMPFKHQKLGEGGKKEQKQADAEKAAGGKFGLRAVK
jgi:phage terminase small subunit